MISRGARGSEISAALQRLAACLAVFLGVDRFAEGYFAAGFRADAFAVIFFAAFLAPVATFDAAFLVPVAAFDAAFLAPAVVFLATFLAAAFAFFAVLPAAVTAELFLAVFFPTPSFAPTAFCILPAAFVALLAATFAVRAADFAALAAFFAVLVADFVADLAVRFIERSALPSIDFASFSTPLALRVRVAFVDFAVVATAVAALSAASFVSLTAVCALSAIAEPISCAFSFAASIASLILVSKLFSSLIASSPVEGLQCIEDTNKSARTSSDGGAGPC